MFDLIWWAFMKDKSFYPFSVCYSPFNNLVECDLVWSSRVWLEFVYLLDQYLVYICENKFCDQHT